MNKKNTNTCKLTIGCPTCYDYSGTLMAVHALLKYHKFEELSYEILVIDNTPDDKYRNSLKAQINGIDNPRVRYVEFTEKRGPAESKNKVIENARGEYVLCMDGHVLLEEGTVERLLDFLNNIPKDKENDFFTGPLSHNNNGTSTHFDNVWRGQMQGIWANDPELLKDDELKPIWGNGCGLFIIKRDSWLGFNKSFKGFGGEEGYIHEKYRKHGQEVYLIPWLRWWHRFGNPDTKHYLLTRFHKVRNYVLGHLELDLPLFGVFNHFVSLGDFKTPEELKDHLRSEHSVPERLLKTDDMVELQKVHSDHKLSQEEWEYILQDPIKHEDPEEGTIKEMFDTYKLEKSNDLGEHFDLMLKYAKKVDTIGDISRRSLSVLPALRANPKKIMSALYQGGPMDIEKLGLKNINIKTIKYESAIKNCEEIIGDVELLFFQFPHECNSTVEDLLKVAKNIEKYIIIRETKHKYRPEIEDAMRALIETGEWFVIEHTNVQWGTTVLSRDKPNIPVIAWYPEKGPGTEIKKLLKKIGIVASPNCNCNAYANMMDLNGEDWVLENIETVVDWLQSEADKRKLPFLRVAGKTLVKLAVRKSRKNNKKCLKNKLTCAI